MSDLYVPASGKPIPMPGNQPAWPVDGQAINPVDPMHHRMVLDGDLVIKPAEPAEKTKGK